ncbi:hypothetical protein EHQ68_02000 [Leptospira congkakensis]|uniref:Capsule biosynthesis protein n=1 Tax=Leptospira congkakensis TaxID=2484932 RepID=A0A4Z1A5F8_9LEPT|nr:hypothetical protein [Leptospira congkakensis]TGL90231.1 hypothetical protein EHQ69_09765 [Leptospira congkakensis]TGL91237.1 hypothetical protein EHQ68_02000 [Leptospira congkakensis]TGL98289.1 hypothetical protein EHQ70_01590 [Leptospira congkakensis]
MKILFFSPHALITLHSLPELQIAKYLKSVGHEVHYVTCDGVFSNYCVSMASENIDVGANSIEKESICKKCRYTRDILIHDNMFINHRLDQYILDSDYIEVEKHIAAVTAENFLDYEVLGIKVFRLASYEPLLKFKKISCEFDKDEWQTFLIYARNCLISLYAYARLYSKISPDVLFAYSPQYGVNNAVFHFSMLRGNSCYFIEGSSNNAERYEAVRVWKWQNFYLLNPALDYWNRRFELIRELDLDRIKGHFDELLKAKSFAVYSSAVSGNFKLENHFNIKKGAKIILASLSSSDEAYSAYIIGGFPGSKVESKVFKNQFEWIRETISIVSNDPNLHLIIRLHPRDLQNKRESVVSEQFSIWQSILKDLPANVSVNYPTENISLYDLLKEIDLLVTGWSATGIEALSYGIPVVTYDENLPSYPRLVHYTGNSLKTYRENIFKALEDGWNIRNVENSYLWMALSFSAGTVRIPSELYSKIIKRRNLIFRILKKFFKLLGLRGIFFKLENWFTFSIFKKAVELKCVDGLVKFNLKNLYEYRLLNNQVSKYDISKKIMQMFNSNLENLYKYSSDDYKSNSKLFLKAKNELRSYK